MKFLLDVHVSTAIARALAERGHDVARAALSYATASDLELLAIAAHELRIVVTQDRDFSDLIYAFSGPIPPAVIYLRCEPEDQSEMIERILTLLDSPTVQDHMTVLRRSSTRSRPLPKASNENG